MTYVGSAAMTRTRPRNAPRIAGGGQRRGDKSWSRTFEAKYETPCSRCPRKIEVGDTIRYHDDYPDVVHAGCSDGDAQEPAYVIIGARKPSLCMTCFMEHNGECP